MFEFQCKKCKNIFSTEQHPLFQSLKDKLSAEPKKSASDEVVKAFWETIVEITKQTTCPQCHSSAYLISVGGIKFDKGIDATSEPLVQIIKGLVDLHAEYKLKTSIADSFMNYSDEVADYVKEIADHLMWHPGELVYFEDESLRKEAKEVLDSLWKTLTYDELSEEMFSGGFSGLMVNIVGDYIERVKMIKPTLITVKPSNEIRTYFQQAMDAWSHGLNTASLILSCSILEAILKQVLLRKDAKLVYDIGNGKSFKDVKEKDLEALIENARKKRIFDDGEAKKADKIRKNRNAAVHKLKQFSSDETYKAIITTKELLEKLLT